MSDARDIFLSQIKQAPRCEWISDLTRQSPALLHLREELDL